MRRLVSLVLLLLLSPFSPAQTSTPMPLSPTLARSEGVELTSNIAFTRLYLTAPSGPAPTEFDLSRPTLTVQCSQRPNGRFLFELFVNFGGIKDIDFDPPWHPTPASPNPPLPTEKVSVTMEFLGYTKVKPATRQFELVAAPVGQLRYNSPGVHSHNLEEIAYYLRYLRSLPTLRLSYPSHSATFLTEPLLAQIRKESLCKASGL